MSAWSQRWPQAVVLALMLAAGYWFIQATEWVQEEVTLPLKGEAARKPHYAAARLLRGLGADVAERTQLDELPPPQAVLLLHSFHWALFQGRDQRLREWVENGGHLVLPEMMLLRDGDSLLSWVPIAQVKASQAHRAPAASGAADPQPQEDEDADEPAQDEDASEDGTAPPEGAHAATPVEPRRSPKTDCRSLTEPEQVAPALPPRRSYRLCHHSVQRLRPKGQAVVQWALEDARGTEALRVAHGRGSVTVLGQGIGWQYRGLLEGDHALALVAALQGPGPGRTVWLVSEESRPALPLWLWQHAPAALWLAGIAIALALWRTLPRFGPRLAPELRSRRSMAQQVRGTAEFLWHRDPQALHAAQHRALEEAARQRLPGWPRMDNGARLAALAAATGLPEATLGRALDPHFNRSRAAWPATLALLEQARRRLLDAPSPLPPQDPHGT